MGIVAMRECVFCHSEQIVLNGADELEENHKKVRAQINSVIGRTVTVVVDRPLGSYHPEYKDMY